MYTYTIYILNQLHTDLTIHNRGKSGVQYYCEFDLKFSHKTPNPIFLVELHIACFAHPSASTTIIFLTSFMPDQGTVVGIVLHARIQHRRHAFEMVTVNRNDIEQNLRSLLHFKVKKPHRKKKYKTHLRIFIISQVYKSLEKLQNVWVQKISCLPHIMSDMYYLSTYVPCSK